MYMKEDGDSHDTLNNYPKKEFTKAQYHPK